ncbi:ATP-binding protein [Cellulomonas aerilata]|uniref:Histidine kinase/HSP90-like ATPase domain-containing protein n=1 Tax=Cellulomonas aerilata TaxID=515326 RepID=A0A512DFM7_9CELL|nr:ATP-binding protein [Cellulomonas aerilata]GEO35277.1 hypothetical protein CAE01nite_30020 [Cellulomonas aerilata]
MDQRRRTEPGVELVGRPAVQMPSPRGTRPASLAAPPGPFVPHRARELTRAACRAWRLPEVTDLACLVADELVTNAVVHAQTFLELQLTLADGELVVAVHDRDPGWDAAWWDCTPDDVDAPRGARYGLCLVRTLAHRYGVYPHPSGGKVVWATLPADGGTRPHAPDDRAGTDTAPRPGPPPAPVRRTIVVNRARPGPADRERWRLELVLGWLPTDPDHVDLTLRPTPLHPALPAGNWRARLDTLRRGLGGSGCDDDVHIHPHPAGRTVIFELAAKPPHLVQCPFPPLRGFLDAVDAATRTGQRDPATSDRLT